METINVNSNDLNNSKFSKIMEYAEFNKFGVMSMLLIFVGCLGGITVGLTGFQSDFALISVIIPTMTMLSLILSIQPIKYILTAGLIATIIDLLILLTFSLF